MEISSKALEVLSKYPLCDSCLGRLFALLARGVDNADRGRSLKLVLMMEADMLRRCGKEESQQIIKTLAVNGCFKPALNALGKKEEDCPPCYICGSVMAKIEKFALKALEGLADYDYSTFLVGVSVPSDMAEREDAVRSEFSMEFGESLKSEINRAVGKFLALRTGKEISFEKPDVVIRIDLSRENVEIKPMPLFIRGRYRKLVRGLPQSKWICTKCQGRGCSRCNFTGKMYETSVEELVTQPTLEATMGTKAKFHGAGREDVDARVLGSGRPFVVEVLQPKKRLIDLRDLQKQINERAASKIEVFDLSFSDRKYVRKVKERAKITKKMYRALIEVDSDIAHESLLALEKIFKDRVIHQYTPARVLHRRADKLRVKKVYSVKVGPLKERSFEAIITCQGGLYVKELVSGDGGRTSPSFSEALNTNAKCIELDVLDVLEDDEQ